MKKIKRLTALARSSGGSVLCRMIPSCAILFMTMLVCFSLDTMVFAGTQPANWVVLFSDNFEKGLGAWLESQSSGTGAGWTIQKDGGNSVLAGTGFSNISLDSRQGQWTGFRFKAAIKLLKGNIQLIYRDQGCKRYFVGFDLNGVSLSRATYCGPELVNLAHSTKTFALGQWYTAEIVGIGASIKMYLDGALIIDVTDTDYVGSGGVGFSAPTDSQVQVAAVEISGPTLTDKLLWRKTGGPIGGLGYDVKMRWGNPDTMYVTDTFSGINISTDGGRTWAASNEGITTRVGPSGDAVPVFCATVDPHNPDVVWVGTQNMRSVFKSTDAGKTWANKSTGFEGDNLTFRGITVDPNDANVVYAAAEIPSIVWAGKDLYGKALPLTKGVVYRSRNGGESWTAIWRGENLARFIWIDPRNSNVIYISTGIFDREAANANPQINDPGGVGIVKSTDGGQTWRALNQANGLHGLYVGSLHMNPMNADILLAGSGTGQYTDDGGVYLSTDGGEHWVQGVNKEYGQPFFQMVTAVKFSATNTNIAYAGGPSEFDRSEDGGRTWQRMAGGPPQGYYGPPGTRTGTPIDIQIDPRNTDRLFLNNYTGGNFLTEDGGRTWQVASKGYTGAQIRGLAVALSDPQRVYAIGRSGPFRSNDAGENWLGLQYGMMPSIPTSAIAADPQNLNTVILSDDADGLIFRSTNGGLDWNQVYNHRAVFSGSILDRHGFKSFAFAPSNSNIVYAGSCLYLEAIDAGRTDPSFGIFKSTDNGLTWKESNDTNSIGQNINVLVVDPRNEKLVYAGTVTSGVLRSIDGGNSWLQMNKGLQTLDVRAMVIDSKNPNVIYAGCENGGVYKTTDAAISWQMISAGMDPQAIVRAIAIDRMNTQIVYAGDLRTGVYRSENGGNLWVQTSQGLTTRAIQALAISSDGGTLYAATEGEGVFVTNIGSTSCTYTLSPSSYGYNALNGTGTVTVTPSPSTCTWTATNSNAWITVTSGASGTGTGTISYSIAANTGSARTGTIIAGGQTFTITQAGWTYSNSIGSRNLIKVTDMSGTLSTSGGTIIVNAWDTNGNSIPESGSAVSVKLYSNGTTTISGTDLAARFPTGTPTLYGITANSSKVVITNVMTSIDGTLNIPTGYASDTTKFVTNSVGSRNSIKITDMSGSLSTSGASITVKAWDTNGVSLAESSKATALTLANHGTTIISGTDLMARFPSATPMSYEFTVGSSQLVLTNVKSSADGSINIPYGYAVGTTDFVANSIGARNTIKITDMSGSLSTSGEAITITAWDANGIAIPESSSATPLMLYSHGTTSITGTNLAARFPTGTPMAYPMAYDFSVASTKYIITNVKISNDGSINIPYVYTGGTTKYATNFVSSKTSINISDLSGAISGGTATITVLAWDVDGNAIVQSGSAVPLTLANNGTKTISGSDLIARFPSGTPVSYEFTIGSSQYEVTSLTANTAGTINIPTIYASGVAGGI